MSHAHTHARTLARLFRLASTVVDTQNCRQEKLDRLTATVSAVRWRASHTRRQRHLVTPTAAHTETPAVNTR